MCQNHHCFTSIMHFIRRDDQQSPVDSRRVSPFNTDIHYESCGTRSLFPYRGFWAQELELWKGVNFTHDQTFATCSILPIDTCFSSFFNLPTYESRQIGRSWWKWTELVVSFYPSYLATSSVVNTTSMAQKGSRVSIKMGVENNFILSKIVWITRWKKISWAERERNHILSVIYIWAK